MRTIIRVTIQKRISKDLLPNGVPRETTTENKLELNSSASK